MTALTGGMPAGGPGPGGMAPDSPGLTMGGGQGPSSPQSMDMAGILQMGQALSEGVLTLAQVIPAAATQLGQANELIMGALAQYVQAASSSTALAPGPQFPGGGMSGGAF